MPESICVVQTVNPPILQARHVTDASIHPQIVGAGGEGDRGLGELTLPTVNHEASLSERRKPPSKIILLGIMD